MSYPITPRIVTNWPSSWPATALTPADIAVMVTRTRRRTICANIRAFWRAARRWPALRGVADRAILHIRFDEPNFHGQIGFWRNGTPTQRDPILCVQVVAWELYEPYFSFATVIHELAHVFGAYTNVPTHSRRWRRAVRELVQWLGIEVSDELAAAKTVGKVDHALYEICRREIRPLRPEEVR